MLLLNSVNNFAYSRPASTSCIEHGPVIKSILLSFPCTISEIIFLESETMFSDFSEIGISSIKTFGGVIGE